MNDTQIIPTTVQDLFNLSRSQWIEGARTVAKRLLKNAHQITIEDVLHEFPRPQYIHKNTTGSVFQDEAFVIAGYTKAKKRSSNGRAIGLWTLSDNYLHKLERDCE